jgi:hypothetical protein
MIALAIDVEVDLTTELHDHLIVCNVQKISFGLALIPCGSWIQGISLPRGEDYRSRAIV